MWEVQGKSLKGPLALVYKAGSKARPAALAPGNKYGLLTQGEARIQRIKVLRETAKKAMAAPRPWLRASGSSCKCAFEALALNLLLDSTGSTEIISFRCIKLMFLFLLNLTYAFVSMY